MRYLARAETRGWIRIGWRQSCNSSMRSATAGPWPVVATDVKTRRTCCTTCMLVCSATDCGSTALRRSGRGCSASFATRRARSAAASVTTTQYAPPSRTFSLGGGARVRPFAGSYLLPLPQGSCLRPASDTALSPIRGSGSSFRMMSASSLRRAARAGGSHPLARAGGQACADGSHGAHQEHADTCTAGETQGTAWRRIEGFSAAAKRPPRTL